jgi:diguanylate cyclase (GGDEF)-like protein/PAS domain S-box-containing protein
MGSDYGSGEAVRVLSTLAIDPLRGALDRARLGCRSATRLRLNSYVLAAIATAVAGLVLSVAAWSVLWVREDRFAELELRERADNGALLLQYGINEDLKTLKALRALFQTSTRDIGRKEFQDLTEMLLRDMPAVQNLSWAPRVTKEERAELESAAARDGLADFHIRSVTPGGLVRSEEREEYFPILYSTAPASSLVYGLDLNSEPMRRDTIERARDNDQPAASAIFRLPAQIGDWRTFFVLLPVYWPDLPRDTVEDRRRNLKGFVQGVFRVRTMIEGILSRANIDTGLDLYLYAATADDDATPIFHRPSSGTRNAGSTLSLGHVGDNASWPAEIRAGDGRWTLVAVPVPGGPGTPNHQSAWLALLGGLLVTALVVGYIRTSGRNSVVALKAANARLSAQNERFDAALQNMLQGLIMLDPEQRVVVCNDRYIEMYGLSREIARPGASAMEILRHRAEHGHFDRDIERYRREMLTSLAPGRTATTIVRTPRGREVAIASKAMAGGGWVVTHEDITERRQAEARIAHMALHDALTGLPNRVKFHKEMESSLALLEDGGRFAVLCLDLDNFKTVNDTLGHRIGDRLLHQVAQRLRGCLHASDSLARLGGDEFAVVQGGVEATHETAALVSRITEALAAPFDIDGNQVVVGASIGIAVAPTDARDADQLLKNADMALYRAKADGRGTYRYFEPQMDARMQARHALERDLRMAIANGEFELHYQPIVNLETERPCGFEALIRWNHPTRGTVPPLEFISIAEETGLILPIGEWVLRQACAEAASWPDGIRVAVNVSPAQFRKPGLSQTVVNALASSGLQASRLEVEITESVLLLNSESTLATLHQLRALGVRISMDDFGTGYSSLSYLRSFPFDKIKIDGSFVRDLHSSRDSKAIVRAVAVLGSSLRVATTAEGIETQAEFEHLRSEGCTEGQGYLFGKPRPAREIAPLLAAYAGRIAATG